MSEIGLPLAVGNRVVVTGIAGAGKSTFSRALSAKTGLPVIHLDLHRWNPGWIRMPEGEFRRKQRALLASEEWIVDGNVALDLRFERAEREREFAIASQCRGRVAVHILRSTRAAQEFVDRATSNGAHVTSEGEC